MSPTSAGVDLVILAAPVRQNVAAASRGCRRVIARRRRSITDVGGTKRDIVKAARALPARRLRSSAAIPIGGAERGGFGVRPARPVPGPAVDSHARRRRAAAPAVRATVRFVDGLGARPTTMDADEHDRRDGVREPSAAADGERADGGRRRRGGAERPAVAGRGLVDTTRLASSPADVWRDICATNADAIGAALDQLIAR